MPKPLLSMLLLSLLVLGPYRGLRAQRVPVSGLAISQKLVELPHNEPQKFFELLGALYPESERPVSVVRIYEDYRMNPYLGDTIAQKYNELISRPQFQELYNETPTVLLNTLNDHQKEVEARKLILDNLRTALKRLVVNNAEPAKLIALRKRFKPEVTSDDEARITSDNTYRLLVSARLLTSVLARFEVVANGVAKLQPYEEQALKDEVNYNIATLFGQLQTADSKVATARQKALDLRLKDVGNNAQNIAAEVLIDPRVSLTFSRQNIGLAPVAIPQPPSAASLETAVLDGLARFVAKRMKQELKAAFFERFNALLHDSSYVEMRTLFPNTTRLVARGSVDYSAIIQLLRNAFEEDLRQLLVSLNHLLDKPPYSRLLNPPAATTPQDKLRLAQALRYTHIALFVLQDIQTGTHPRAIIARLEQQLVSDQGFPPYVQQTARVLNVLSEAFLNEGNLQESWADAKTVETLLQPAQQRQLRYFLGVLHQRLLSVDVALPMLAEGARLQQVAFGFARLSTTIQAQLTLLQKKSVAEKKEDRLEPEDYLRLYQLALSLTSFASEYIVDERLPQVQQAEVISQAIMEGYQAALQGRYGVTVSNLMKIVNITLPSDELRNRSQILRYAPFMAAVAEARNPEDIEQAIEAIALPAGSASVKRKTFSSITLNAFPGITGGREYVYLPNPGTGHDKGAWATNLGFTAPIGVCFSRAVRGIAIQPKTYRRQHVGLRVEQNYHYFTRKGREHYLKGRAVSVFVSIIDIGALVQFRLNDSLNNSPLPQNVSFRQVLSPGLFFLYNTGRSPISFFGGAAFSPELRQFKLNPTDKQADQANSLRVNVGITIDIPLLSLYARSERRQHNLDPLAVAERRKEDLAASRRYFDDRLAEQQAKRATLTPSSWRYRYLERKIENTKRSQQAIPAQ